MAEARVNGGGTVEPGLASTGVHPNSQDNTNGSTPEGPLRYGQPLPPEWIPLYKKPMRTPTRKLRVVIIGGAVSAMNLAYKIYHGSNLPPDMVELCIYEANESLGGTWLVNTYPGVACDVPAHIYAFPFEPNPDWSAFYASGAEILQYFTRTVAKYKLDRDLKCGHRVERAVFDAERGKWDLRVATKDGSIDDSCDILVSATGILSKWRWPSIPGLQTFEGDMYHSASWGQDFNAAGKRVAVIGNGSSAIQIIPQMVEEAAHLTNFIRRPTYITAGLGSANISGQAQHYYSEEERKRFRDDPEELKRYRKQIQAGSNKGFQAFDKESEEQATWLRQTVATMTEQLGGDEELAKKLIPTHEIGCRRATPGPGYLESFQRENVSLVTEPIECVETRGIRTADGKLHGFDAIICATGFDVSHRPSWPLIGRHGTTLASAWRDEPTSYLSLAASGFPNFFMFAGPNAPVGHGSLMAALEWMADWMCQWARKMAEEDIRWVDPKPEVVAEFDVYADEIMQTLVWSGGCQSWYKSHRGADSKVTAVWAGSAIGFKEMIDRIRPEDFEIAYNGKNRFRFMGNGRTKMEYEPGADLAFYLHK